MRTRHLDDDELDRLLAGEELVAGEREHLDGCLVCRRRRDAFFEAVREARREDPEESVLEAARKAALTASSQRRGSPRGPWRWALAAAAAVILAIVATFSALPSRRAEINAEAVLAEVDEMLASDPLTLIAPAEVVDVVLAPGDPELQENAS